MVRDNVVEHAKTKRPLPIVSASNMDGSLQFSVRYRNIIVVTKRNGYPIPRVDVCIDSLRSTKMFFVLNANSDHSQLEPSYADMNKTAWVTQNRLNRFTRMPFGIKNAFATFHRVMDTTLASVKRQHALDYLNDVAISKSSEEHLQHAKSVPQLMQKASVTLKLKNYFFFSNAMDFSGHMILLRQLYIAMKTANAIQNLQYATTTFGLRFFERMCNFYLQCF